MYKLMQNFLGIKSFCSVQTNQPVIDPIRKINVRNKAFSITNSDFSTLYKNIPRNKLKNMMWEPISVCVNGGEKKFIDVTKFDATLIDDKFKTAFDKASLKLAINFLLGYCFFFHFDNL